LVVADFDDFKEGFFTCMQEMVEGKVTGLFKLGLACKFAIISFIIVLSLTVVTLHLL